MGIPGESEMAKTKAVEQLVTSERGPLGCIFV